MFSFVALIVKVSSRNFETLTHDFNRQNLTCVSSLRSESTHEISINIQRTSIITRCKAVAMVFD